MKTTLAFDIYGTLINTHGVVSLLRQMIGERAAVFSDLWREKQLEYTFRRGLMQYYADFSVCTRDALDYTCARLKTPLEDKQKNDLMDTYRVLPPFGDVKQSLSSLKNDGFRLYAFSNGTRKAVDGLLVAADIRDFFLDVVSVDDIRSYKPNPAVYAHFMRKAGGGDSWLVSSNPFDVIGAVAAGMRSVWLRRREDAVFDPWGVAPDLTISSLDGIAGRLAAYYQQVD